MLLPRVSARRQLGQHFLQSKTIARRIAAAVRCNEHTAVIEVGAGTGALTAPLLERKLLRLIAIEIDERTASVLREQFGAHEKFSLVNRDVLSLRLADLDIPLGAQVCVVGNIPYNITGPLLFWLFEQTDRICHIVIMVQKEVAQRIVAVPGSKTYGMLSVATALVSRSARVLFDVPPGAFFPAPRVTSSVVEIESNGLSLCNEQYARTMKLVKAAFNQRRKKLRNALARYIQEQHPGFAPVLLTLPIMEKRAEQLVPNEFVMLAEMLHSENISV